MPANNTVSTASLTLDVNGQSRSVQVRHHWTLLDVIREQLDLTGSKRGCDRGECGSCTVLLDGKPVYSCQILAVQVGRRPVVTIEGLGVEGLSVEGPASEGPGSEGLGVEGLSVEGPASEGPADIDNLDSVQRAFLENDGGQCGFCTPGFVMSARALLDTNPNPTDEEIRQALSGNLCRCNAYGRIIESVRAARRG